jgi:hypothetical protein
MTAWDTDQLADLIRRKHECLARLHELGRSQVNFVSTGELTELLLVLSGKQQLLDQLHSIDRELDPYRHQQPESRCWRTLDDRRRCAALADECEVLLREIVEQERDSEAQLRARRDETAARLDTVHVAHQARGAYADFSSGSAAHVDFYSES